MTDIIALVEAKLAAEGEREQRTYQWCERNESSASAHGHTKACYKSYDVPSERARGVSAFRAATYPEALAVVRAADSLWEALRTDESLPGGHLTYDLGRALAAYLAKAQEVLP